MRPTILLLALLACCPALAQDEAQLLDTVELLRAENTILRQELAALRERLETLEASVAGLKPPIPESEPGAPTPSPVVNTPPVPRLVATLRHDGPGSVTWTPHDALVSGGKDGTLRVWDGSSGAQQRLLQVAEDGVIVVRCSGDGDYVAAVATGRSGGSLKIYETRDWGEACAVASDGMGAVAWARDRRRLAYGEEDSDLLIVVDERGRLQSSFRLDETPGPLSWGPGDDLAIAVSKTVQIWDVAKKQELRRLDHREEVSGLAWSPSSTTVATVSAGTTLTLWNAEQGRQLREFSLLAGSRRLAWNPAGTRIAVGGSTHVQVLELETGAVVAQAPQPKSVNDLAWSADGERLAVSCNDDTIRVYELP